MQNDQRTPYRRVVKPSRRVHFRRIVTYDQLSTYVSLWWSLNIKVAGSILAKIHLFKDSQTRDFLKFKKNRDLENIAVNENALEHKD